MHAVQHGSSVYIYKQAVSGEKAWYHKLKKMETQSVYALKHYNHIWRTKYNVLLEDWVN